MVALSNILTNGKLVPEKEWKKYINSLENSIENMPKNQKKAKEILKQKLIEAVNKRTAKKFGISFSGGVDSSFFALICKKLKCNFACCAVGLKNSPDIKISQKAADKLKLKLKYKVINLNELEKYVENVVSILKTDDVTKVGVGAVFYAAALLAKKNKIDILFSGLGSEEIFAGYERHKVALGKEDYNALHKECWSGLKNMWDRDLRRDYSIAKALHLDVKTPFLDQEVIIAAMNIHPKFKLDKVHKKVILREIAEDSGLPKEFAFRPKKAAQYGSNFIKGLDKLAKMHGFKLKKDYLKSLI